MVLLTIIGAMVVNALFYTAGLNVASNNEKWSKAAAWSARTATGASIAMFCWTLSLYIFKSTLPGSILFAVIAIASCARYRMMPTGSLPGRMPVLAILIATSIATWHTGAQWLPYRDGIAVSDRFGDYGLHVSYATIVSANGLPLKNTNGLVKPEFEGAAHTGLLVLLAGVVDLVESNFPLATHILVVIAYVLTAVSAYALIEELASNPFIRFCASLSPFLWTSISVIPIAISQRNYGPLLDPVSCLQSAVGNQFHNCTQLWCVSLTFAGLVCLKLAFSASRSDSFLTLATTLFVTAGLVKPSLVILVIPALLIVLFMTGYSSRSGWCGVSAALLIGGVTYYMPLAFQHDSVPSTWQFDPSIAVLASLVFPLTGIAVGAAIVFCVRFDALLRDRSILREPKWSDVALISAFGGFLFAVLFHESGIRATHGNQFWGFWGTITLLAPHVVVFVLEADERRQRFGHGIHNSLLRRVAATIVLLHIVSGVSYVVTYPVWGLRLRSIAQANALFEANRLTSADDRFLIDPLMIPHPLSSDMLPFLGRPVLQYHEHIDAEVDRQLYDWKSLVNGNVPDDTEFVSSRNFIIINQRRVELQSWLRAEGWHRNVILNKEYELWKK